MAESWVFVYTALHWSMNTEQDLSVATINQRRPHTRDQLAGWVLPMNHSFSTRTKAPSKRLRDAGDSNSHTAVQKVSVVLYLPRVPPLP